VNALANEEKKSLMTLDGYIVDPTTFAPHHPGGSKTIAKYAGRDITSEM